MDDTRTSRSLFGGAALLMLGLLFAFLVIGSSAAKAETGTKALVLGSSVSGGASSLEATRASNLGFTVTVVDDPTWAAMTAVQFADYQLIVVGDPTCRSLPRVVSQNATALADAVMARAGGNTKAGNRILIGTDPVFHRFQGGQKVVDTGIEFAGVQEGATGLYLDFTCGDPDYDLNGVRDGQDKLLPLLSIDPAPVWTQNPFPPCGGDVSLISNAAQFSTLTSADIRGWSCSVHESFPTFPTDWSALAIATDTPTAPTCGNDVDTGVRRCGEAYLLIAGSGIVSEAPDLSLEPTTDTNPVGTQHTVTATVTNPDDTPRSGVVVSFVVTGANAGAAGTCVPADCTSGADGKVAFTYTGTSGGEDTINAAITVDGSRQTATAAKTWGAAPTTSADVSISKADAPDPVEAGQELTYTITVNNGGPDPAENVAVTDNLPSTVTFGSASASQGTGCTQLTTTVTCPLGTIASGGMATVTIKVTPTTQGTITNTASVSSTTADPDSTDNSDMETTVVDPAVPRCNGLVATFVGGDGDDYFQGGPEVDVVLDSGGDNYLQTGDGDDHVCLGDGDDEIDTGDGNDFVDAGDGKNKIKTGNGSDTVRSGSGDDEIDTGDGDDTVTDTGGRNKIFTGNGSDRVTSGSGDDEIETGNGNDVVVDSGGNNTVNAGDGDDQVTTGDGDDRIDGGNGVDTCSPGGGNNEVKDCEA